MASDTSTVVELYIYDLTHGVASLLAPTIIGRDVEGIWHTAIVAYDREFFYGANGITSCTPGTTQLGPPHRVQRLGETFVPFAVFVEYLQGLAGSTYLPSQYNLLEHNCNHFSDEVAEFLCDARVPKDILQQPEELLAPQQRDVLHALLADLLPRSGDAPQSLYSSGARAARQDSPDYLTLNSQIEQARIQSQELEQRRSTLAEKLARKERKKQKKRKKQIRERGEADGEEIDSDMAEAVEVPLAHEELSRAGPSSEALELEADERRQEEQRKREREPPIVFRDIDPIAEFEKLADALEGVEMSAEERQSLDELQQYLVQGEGSWVLGDDFLEFMGGLLGAEREAVRAAAGGCLAAAALRDDVALLLHQDRRQHALLQHAHRIDALSLPDQRAIATFLCNLFEHVSSSEWLLYISEWEAGGQQLSNIRVTTKVCVHAVLSEDAALRAVGTALMHNISTKERFMVGRALRELLPKRAKSKVFDEVCVELAMALLQVLSCAPAEEDLYRACGALARLAARCADVPPLVALVGPHPAAFRGTSPRVDEQIDLIVKYIK
ncbi:uncharacterized protein LOC101746000 isoform X1 [Bombyx mori]|uniref:PPPDE domain-containing protein n=1 Tax=Bombyx mori TaxID=7091 RepID=A0A8R2HMU0_BOMMO|nr:uncharacterized protein LOC101746000 isoform X2 [Bombyx mori]XP_012546040.2 uncharacterized protein LOC101746000 isoform X2 [Bombyx mori]XP_012546042.2 uncharacterized protein LOC101746000 isoform X2 [Bombyx mori]XP_021203838.2 uncharacterized protein LOC101746000 isoform X2 [Bombyx mori]XP_021203839.2 uncharacterized protein LOC101746000 isoform X2 [Bombyx mori]XP_021203842.2 uncharacterized protein LOC101746000 isoform X2 [Bombyx mori]